MHLITFEPSKIIEAKVNFFCDYFTERSKFSGEFQIWSLETPLSLVDKCIFQYENNPVHRVKYIRHHLKSEHLKSNELLKRFRYYNKIHPYIIEYLNHNQHNERASWLKETPDFYKYLKKLRIELENGLIKNTVDILIGYLSCTCPINKHKKDLKYLAGIIISNLKFRRKPDYDISRLMNKITSVLNR